MRRAVLVFTFFLVTRHSTLAAQNPECAAYASLTQAGRVCNAAVDGARAFHPIVGLLTSGGNPVLGRAGSLGGPARFAITARVNSTKVVLPDVQPWNLRAVVGKRFSMLALAVGLGHDWYEGDASIRFRDPLTAGLQFGL